MNLFNLRRSAPAAVAEPKRAPVIVPHADELSRDRLMPSAERAAQVFVRGQGSWLWDNEGRAYLTLPRVVQSTAWAIAPACW